MNVTDNSGDTITISLIHARVGLGCSTYCTSTSTSSRRTSNTWNSSTLYSGINHWHNCKAFSSLTVIIKSNLITPGLSRSYWLIMMTVHSIVINEPSPLMLMCFTLRNVYQISVSCLLICLSYLVHVICIYVVIGILFACFNIMCDGITPFTSSLCFNLQNLEWCIESCIGEFQYYIRCQENSSKLIVFSKMYSILLWNNDIRT